MMEQEAKYGASVGVAQGPFVLLAVHTGEAVTSVGLTPDAARALATSLMIFADLQEPLQKTAPAETEKTNG